MEIRRAAARERKARSRAAETREDRARRLEANRESMARARVAIRRRVNPNPVGQQSQEILVFQ